jgi:probable HAF family extracellular repeat protein
VGACPSGGSGYRVRDLGVLAGDLLSYARAINNRGQVVGRNNGDGEGLTLYGDDVRNRAWLWESGRMTDLNSLIPPGSGWRLESANDINDRGQIVGVGTLGGRQRAFLLTPQE